MHSNNMTFFSDRLLKLGQMYYFQVQSIPSPQKGY